MLERVWRKGNPIITLLVGMHIGTTTVENSMEIPQKTKNRINIWSSHVCDLHHISRQRHILNPLSKARDWTLILMDTSRIHYHWATTGTPNMCIFEWKFCPDICPGVGLLDDMLSLYLVFWGISILFSTVVVPIHSPTNSGRGFHFLHNLSSICYL